MLTAAKRAMLDPYQCMTSSSEMLMAGNVSRVSGVSSHSEHMNTTPIPTEDRPKAPE
jgi:hypothetical protein